MIRLWVAVMSMFLSATVYAVVPLTHRTQDMIFTRAEVQEVAAQAYHQELKRLSSLNELDTNPYILDKVRRISSQLIAQAILLKPEVAQWPWEVHVSSDPQTAAYSMSGGKLMVGTHFIEHYRLTDQELAVVLGHEIGHVIAEHVREQVSTVAQFHQATPGRRPGVLEVIDDMQTDISVFFRLQPLSRLQEMEADDIGIELAARAGYPPNAVISFYAKLSQSENGQSLLDSHGPVAQRAAFADSMAEYAYPIYLSSLHRRMPPAYVFADTH